ncbi:unnamed protein product [Vicia faba]|uniref:Rx N-terminal domain-containing protein n=1 Tax=Vicia faba TaxID=3906 RepID=A0AAV1B7M8_VICFA|nr:unnamed protein product [Vicia faba]
MADNVVAFLLEHLSQLLQHEANFLSGVEDKIISLHNELEIISIRDVSYLVEDVIDTFITKVAFYKKRNLLGRMFHSVKHAKLLHEVAEKIDKKKTTLNKIHEKKIKYCQESSDQSTSAREVEEKRKSLHRFRRNVEEEDVVGFVHEFEVVINRLIEGGSL